MVTDRTNPAGPPPTAGPPPAATRPPGGRLGPDVETRSTSDLFRELSEEASNLIREEMALARLEMSEKMSKMGRNAAYIGVGGAIAYAGFLALIQAAINGLGVGMWFGMPLVWAAWLSPLIIGVVVGIIGYAFLQKGMSTLKKESVVPEKTVETMRENKIWLQNQVKSKRP
jgi:hypothetical protein